MKTNATDNPLDSGNTIAAVLTDLHANQLILEELMKRYRMFRFTGGTVPEQPWRLAGLAACREQPFLAERIRQQQIERYQQLAQTLMTLGTSVAEDGPRTSRARRAIAESFTAIATEIRAVGALLESALTLLVRERGSNLPIPVTVSS